LVTDSSNHAKKRSSGGFGRSSNGASMQNIEPKFEPLALSSIDWPVIVWVCRTPGVFLAICSMKFIVSWVRWSDVASGSWTFTRR